MKQIALDANVLYDLAAEQNHAHAFREVLQERDFWLRISPTVLQEVTYAALRKTGEEQRLAAKALRSLQAWLISPFQLPPHGHGIAEQFARKLLFKGLLPDSEFNDGLIVAETALVSIPVLVSLDKHLVDMDADLLAGCLADSHLSQIKIVKPRSLLGAFR